MLIEPGKHLILNKPGQSETHLDILKQIKTIVEAASPWEATMIIKNKTKGCIIDAEWGNGLFTVTVTNPEDEIFKLESPFECMVEGCANHVAETPDLCTEHLKQRAEKEI